MQVKRAGLLLLVFLFSLTVHAELDDSLSIGATAYLQTDGADHIGGNPKLDEDEFVFEGIMILNKTLSERDKLNVKLLGDLISSASETRLFNPQFRALQSGASGNKRIATDIGYAHRFDGFTMGVHGGYSYEADIYMSWPYGVNFGIPMMGGNSVLGIRLDGYTDYFLNKYYNGTTHGYAYRQTISTEGSLTQVLSPLDILNLTLTYIFQTGTLQTSYYSVFLNNVEQREIMPPQRHRGAVSARWKHSISPMNTLELGYRFYGDTWNIYSHTAEVKLFQYFFAKRFLLEPSVRFYTQTGAYFYERAFATLPTYRTSDTDLGPFTGAIFGLGASLIRPPFFPFWLDNVAITGNYWLRDDGFQVYWFDMSVLSRF